MLNKPNINYILMHENAVEPFRADDLSAGADLVAISKKEVLVKENGEEILYVEFDTGIGVEIPPGFVGLLFARSSISKTRYMLANCVGVIDASYRGSIRARFKVVGSGEDYNVGERIAQLVIMPILLPTFCKVDKLSDTSRGDNGFGSSGKN